MRIVPPASHTTATSLRPIASALPPFDPPAGQPAPARFDVFAGRTLASGVTDIKRAGTQLMDERFQSNHDGSGAPYRANLVGFLRRGDAWDAVELLVRNERGALEHLDLATDMRSVPGVSIDSVWHLGDFGGDYSRLVLAGRTRPARAAAAS